MRKVTIALVVVSSVMSWAGQPLGLRRTEAQAPLSFPGMFSRVGKVPSNLQGWGFSSSQEGHYEVRCDLVFTDCVTQILRSRGAVARSEEGSVTHTEPATRWRGRRVELRAHLRAGNVSGEAGAFVRIEDAQGDLLAFDDMSNRALRGTTGFEWYKVVLDVPANAERITLGVRLSGEGAIFIRELHFAAVDPGKAAVTDLLARLTKEVARQ